MPKCQKCYEILPGEYMLDKEDGGRVCFFCEADKKSLTLTNEDGMISIVEKKNVIENYRIFMKKLMESENVKKFLKSQGI